MATFGFSGTDIVMGIGFGAAETGSKKCLPVSAAPKPHFITMSMRTEPSPEPHLNKALAIRLGANAGGQHTLRVKNSNNMEQYQH